MKVGYSNFVSRAPQPRGFGARFHIDSFLEFFPASSSSPFGQASRILAAAAGQNEHQNAQHPCLFCNACHMATGKMIVYEGVSLVQLEKGGGVEGEMRDRRVAGRGC